MSDRLCLTSLTLSELEDYLQTSGEKPFRARQIFKGVYQHGLTDFLKFTDLPLALRQKLSEKFIISPLTIEQTSSSADGTVKYLFRLPDGFYVETVLIPSGRRRTVCLSTQVGCKFRCAFCASGLNGFRRNLSPGEIVSQVLSLKYLFGHQTTNLVFMGMGEPLDNLENVLKAVRILNDEQGLNFGARRMTVSTAGVIPGIKQLKNFELQINLSISLHSSIDRQRSQLMPINKKYPLPELVAAAEDYIRSGGRQLTLEYILIKDLNDSLYEAEGLAAIARRLRAKVNLIAYSPVSGLPYLRPSAEDLARFQRWLEERKIKVTVRQSKGVDIAAACGQLAGKFQ
ncbi:MAG: 23S rRNA (adenine(2503)-C(2))-methyltransferase RlmN [Candidatus Saccharicenans sp.]|uniref:23S rRNA (adenine(2503)-C(2))-methyltransferase RlmN n=1 Tax=Candidatus Saccharicenans sp. TaxID=2819258 RepID=UPI00404B8049